MTTARYDGIADWYDSTFAHYADDAADQPGTHLAGLLGSGQGVCVDIGCGTGRGAIALARAGWDVIGVDVSADQLRLAAPRCEAVARGDAHELPFRDASVDHVAAMFLHTDVDDFAQVVAEAARILRPGGVFAYAGVHPCFVGPHIDGISKSEAALRVVPGYRTTGWVFESPQFGAGVRQYVGMNHLPFAAFLHAFLDAGFALDRIDEHGPGIVPWVLGVRARRYPARTR